MIEAVLFDLDDTLYIEGDFFRSGFAVIAQELQLRGIGYAPAIRELLESIHFGEGREYVLNKASKRMPFPEAWIPDLVALFRSHTPFISLISGAADMLSRLRRWYLLGCITDGFAGVQRRKIKALGVGTYLDAIVVADDLGREYWKPSPVPFHTCCSRLGVDPSEAIYIGDNTERDIAGARSAGIISVRIRHKGAYFSRFDSDVEEHADFEIHTLHELYDVLEKLATSRSVM